MSVSWLKPNQLDSVNQLNIFICFPSSGTSSTSASLSGSDAGACSRALTAFLSTIRAPEKLIASFISVLYCFMAYAAYAPMRSLFISVIIRSAEALPAVPARSLTALAVEGSIRKPSVPANRMALSIRSESSPKRSSGTPTALMILFLMSDRPPYSSIRPLLGEYANAFIVKSRLARSTLMSLLNETESGCLPSVYAPSDRNVVISYGSPSIKTVTVPCLMPVSITLYPSKQAFVSSGIADVVMSQSSGFLPIRISRTQPPTT